MHLYNRIPRNPLPDNWRYLEVGSYSRETSSLSSPAAASVSRLWRHPATPSCTDNNTQRGCSPFPRTLIMLWYWGMSCQ